MTSRSRDGERNALPYCFSISSSHLIVSHLLQSRLLAHWWRAINISGGQVISPQESHLIQVVHPPLDMPASFPV